MVYQRLPLMVIYPCFPTSKTARNAAAVFPQLSDECEADQWRFSGAAGTVVPTDRLGGLVHPSKISGHCPHKNPIEITRVVRAPPKR